MKLIGPINLWRVDPSGWVGSTTMLVFAAIAGWRWQATGLVFYALMVLRDAAAAWCLLTRNRDHGRHRFGLADILAYVSSGLPLCYFATGQASAPALFAASNLLTIVGFALATVALFELGASFGVSPADRGVVRTGVYQYLRHPMYVGYAIAELGCAILTPFNWPIYAASMVLYWRRAKAEDARLHTPISIRAEA